MPALRLSEAEQGALSGLPFAAVVLYLALRRRMDFSTGFVGVRPLISWFALAQDLYVEPAPGRSRSGRPHVESVRRLGGVLERAGLVRMRSTERPPRLVFRLPLADVLSLARKKLDRKPTGQADRPTERALRRESIERSREADRASRGEADTHPGSGSRSVSRTAAISYVEPAAAEMVYPQGTTRADREAYMAIARRHRLARDQLQLLLDEIAGAVRERKPITSRPALLAHMVRQLEAGDFYGLRAISERGGGPGLSAAEARILNDNKGEKR